MASGSLGGSPGRAWVERHAPRLVSTASAAVCSALRLNITNTLAPDWGVL